MLPEILLGAGVALGYFLGLVLYHWAKEEIDPFKKTFDALRRSALYLAALYGFFLALGFEMESQGLIALILLGITLVQSALISARIKRKLALSFAVKQAGILVVVFVAVHLIMSAFI